MGAVTGMTYDAEIREYVENRRAEGHADKEIRRCIKRYPARRIYRALDISAGTMEAA